MICRSIEIALFLFAASSEALVSTPLFIKISSHQTQLYSTTTELWKVERVDRIGDWSSYGETRRYPNPLSLKSNIPLSWFVDEDDVVAAKVAVSASKTNEDHEIGLRSKAFTLAGPRIDIHFDPKCCKAAMVTCGGLCLSWTKHGSA